MNEYIIDFRGKGVAVSSKGDAKQVASIDCPELKDEIALPVRYPVTSLDKKLLGTINSFMPEKGKVVMRNGNTYSTLIIDGNGELILKANGRKYDIGRMGLEDLADEESKSIKESLSRTPDVSFSYGYKLRSSEETGTLYFFERKDGVTRANLTLDSSEYLDFLPVIMYGKVKKDAEGKTVKKKAEVKKGARIKRKASDGKFVKFVKGNFQPRILEDAFPYQDQDDEKERFFEYLDKGLRPVILNGPTGNGKSVLTRDYACSKGLPFYFDTGSQSFRLNTAIGKFVPSPGNPIYSPGSLTLAAIFGGLYVLEEMPPIPQDELTGLNVLLETGELPIITQFGHELISAHPNFRFVATGNFHSNYTTNELNDALMQRFTQLKIGYPSKENTIDILQARAPGLDYETAELITDAIFDMREETVKFSKDLGLKGAVELSQRLVMGSDIPMRALFEDNIVNPLTTYENNIERRDGKLYSKLMEIVDKYA